MFKAYPKTQRLENERYTLTEKLDGTNACIIISDDGKEIGAQSRTRLIMPENDNYGFAKWVNHNKEELLELGPGHHFGEWWGQGIQRNYNQKEKQFSLFNVERWTITSPPKCCQVVPVLISGILIQDLIPYIDFYKNLLKINGSIASPGFMNPEGIVIYCSLTNICYKEIINK